MKKLLFIILLICVKQVNSQIITTVAGNGTGSYGGDGGQASVAELNGPTGVAFDKSGNMYIADQSNNRIRKITTTGLISTIAGNGAAGFGGDLGQATAAKLNSPWDIAIDMVGNVYIADGSNHRIRKIDTSGVIHTVAGNGTQGFSGDGGQATAAKLNYPSGLTTDALGNLYIADGQNNRIRLVNTAGVISTIVGNGTPGAAGDGGQATAAEIDNIYGVVVDAMGNIYIPDGPDNLIRKVDASGIISTIGGIETGGFTGDGGQATAAELNFPIRATIDGAGNLYIADSFNNRVRVINSLGVISTIVGNGTSGFSGDGAQATAAELNSPTGITFDAIGNLYIADQYNNRIRMVNNVAQASIHQVANNNTINIYPNPAQNIFTIETSNAEKKAVFVYDVNSKLILSQTINGNTTIDANIFTNGVYNINITENSSVVNKKLIILK
jgi:sugar lactone lactonase YvrE